MFWSAFTIGMGIGCAAMICYAIVAAVIFVSTWLATS